jgi:hypothetical protein
LKRLLLIALIALFATAWSLSFSRPASAANVVIYNSLPAALPGNGPSVGFQANHTDELGDVVQFAPGTSRHLTTVTVLLSSQECTNWMVHNYPTIPCATVPGTSFPEDIRVNLYTVNGTMANPSVGSLIATQTQTFNIPYRPSADATNCAGSDNWFSTTDGKCDTGLAFEETLDFTAQNVTLPDMVIWGIQYNTQTFGYAPIGIHGPYDSLNVIVKTYPGQIGTDDPDVGFIWIDGSCVPANGCNVANYTFCNAP